MPLKRLICGLLGLFLMVPLVSFVNHSDHAKKGIKIIVIDPGHGGVFHGASGDFSREQDVTLQVAMKLGKAIEASMKDVKVIYTRTSDTQLASSLPADLRERVNIANRAKADLLIAIHCNSMGNTSIVTGYRKNSNGKRVPIYKSVRQTSTKGSETYVAGSERLGEQTAALGEYEILKNDYKEDAKLDPKNPENSILLQMLSNENRKKSILLASLMQDEYVAVGRINRGFQEKSLAVLRTATMPAVLTEIGFISNPAEEEYINSESGQNEIVNCLLKAIQAYNMESE